jgi:hypothetical protein
LRPKSATYCPLRKEGRISARPLSLQRETDLVKLPAILASAEVALPASTATGSASSAGPLTPLWWTGFVHHECSPHQLASVTRLRSLHGNRIVIDLYEAKPARLTAKTVAQNIDTIDMNTGLCKERLDVRFSRFVGQVPHEELSHSISPNCVVGMKAFWGTDK